MKEAIDEVKNEVNAKLLFWKNIKSRKVKAMVTIQHIYLI
jgi:hypothetical protein